MEISRLARRPRRAPNQPGLIRAALASSYTAARWIRAKARQIAQCRAERLALGTDPQLCDERDEKPTPGITATVTIETYPIDQSDGDSMDPRKLGMRKPGFVIESDFTSVNDSDVVGLHWPGGELELRLIAKNAQIALSVAGAANPARCYLPSDDEPVHRSTVAAGDYLIWLEPADRKAPLTPYTLSVSEPQ